MEESEKRKERLRAMRMEAARAESSHQPEDLPGPGSLTNPLIETAGSPSMHEESCAPPRFDYYTDPMAAFSANKRKNNPGNHTQYNYSAPNRFPHANASSPSVPGPRNLETRPSPQAFQWQQPSYSPNQPIYPPHLHQPRLPPHQSPRTMFVTSPMHEGMPPQAWTGPNFHHQYNNPPNSNYSLGPNFRHSGHPSFSPRHGSPNWRGNSTRGMNPTGPSPSFGRGRGQWSGGRGVGFHGRGSGRGYPMGPDRFYHDSMIEDPWKDMTPVVWTQVGASSSSSWMPQSIHQKKPRVAEPPKKFSGGLNLAEFLAASFKEAADDETETTPET